MEINILGILLIAAISSAATYYSVRERLSEKDYEIVSLEQHVEHCEAELEKKKKFINKLRKRVFYLQNRLKNAEQSKKHP